MKYIDSLLFQHEAPSQTFRPLPRDFHSLLGTPVHRFPAPAPRRYFIDHHQSHIPRPGLFNGYE